MDIPRAIGMFVIVCVLMAVPVLATLSIVCDWCGFLKVVCTSATVGEALVFTIVWYINED